MSALRQAALTGRAGHVHRDESMKRALRAELLPSAAFVDTHGWDALVSDDDFFNSQGWLASLDEAFGAAPLLTVTGRAGILAGCALWDGERSPGMFSLASFFPEVPGPWARDFLWLGARRSTHNEIPCVTGPRRAEALARLGREAMNLAALRGLGGAVIPYMPISAALEFAEVSPGAVILLHSAEASLRIPQGGLSELTHQLGKHNRMRTNTELRAFAKKGNRVEWSPVDEAVESVAARLIAQNRARHGSLQGEEWMRKILAGQRKSGVLKSAVVASAKRGEQTTALAVFYTFGQSLHLRYFGSDYDVANDDFRYFVLAYYASIDRAVAQGAKVLRLSISSLRAKVLRGAHLDPLVAVVLPRQGERIDREAASKHNANLQEQFQKEFAGHMSPEWALISD
ncbi:peptidogalycan biosysnthesis protein [Chondromyces crocatus]|uniref:BioF2-like acetyltransferase domain-containing protein n=1 Tax=Chondromyces crocatus TaxID=52 RepID=A0A0K1EMM5_CHOCO|nr:peptidogalycan biosysnthesis protein [Chondromyces crocatus]AKT42056.1 uncharacterized protein CMC5_062790 [Chondromyces crocatus]